MFDDFNDDLQALLRDEDEAAICLILKGLRGDARALTPEVEANLLNCATTAFHHGRRMSISSQDGLDTLAAICLVLGDRRTAFFENVFLDRMISNPELTAQEKLNRVVEIVIGTIPRPASHLSNDNPYTQAI